MKEKIVLLLFLPFALMGQDYVVDEIFEPDNFSAKITEVSPKNRVIYSWGWNMNNDQSDLIKEFQSNYFDVRYQYNITLTKKLYLNIGFGYNWSAYQLNNDSSTLYIDSVFHEKRKLRFQNMSGMLGIRFQGDQFLNKAVFFEANLYGDLLARSIYLTRGMVDGMNYKNKISKLNFIDKYQHGFEFRIGYKNICFFSKTRISMLVNNLTQGVELPKVTFGFQIDIPASGDI
tara:strand:- start:114 stop:806 length:693 start_codon:yes stop_codon:yes gene_type:complete